MFGNIIHLSVTLLTRRVAEGFVNARRSAETWALLESSQVCSPVLAWDLLNHDWLGGRLHDLTTLCKSNYLTLSKNLHFAILPVILTKRNQFWVTVASF